DALVEDRDDDIGIAFRHRPGSRRVDTLHAPLLRIERIVRNERRRGWRALAAASLHDALLAATTAAGAAAAAAADRAEVGRILETDRVRDSVDDSAVEDLLRDVDRVLVREVHDDEALQQVRARAINRRGGIERCRIANPRGGCLAQYQYRRIDGEVRAG